MSEEIEGLPNVDLSAVAESLNEDKGTEDVKEQVTEDLAQFKSADDLLKGYKELQGTFTKTSQKNKALEGRIAELEEQIKLSTSVGTIQRDPKIDDTYYEDPQAAIHQIVLTQRIAEVLEDEQDASPDINDFRERYSYAQRVIQQYPNLAQTAGGVKKAFKAGDKLRAETLKQSGSKLIKTIFGDDFNEDELENLKSIVKGNQKTKTNNKSNAYMPDTDTTTNRTQNQKQNKNGDQMAQSLEKGDVDGVLNEIFSGLMAE
jgi:hypothetical protein